MRTCTKCHKTKECSEFFVDRQKKDGLSIWCKECKYETNKKWSLENKSRHKNLQSRWQSSRRGYRNKYVYQWREINRERVRYLDRLRTFGKHREKYKRYLQSNRDRYRRHAAFRRAQKIKATPAWADMKEIAWYYQYAQELSLLDGIEYHVDHIVPLNHPLVCGLHTEANLRVITAEENIRKSNKLPESVCNSLTA